MSTLRLTTFQEGLYPCQPPGRNRGYVIGSATLPFHWWNISIEHSQTYSILAESGSLFILAYPDPLSCLFTLLPDTLYRALYRLATSQLDTVPSTFKPDPSRCTRIRNPAFSVSCWTISIEHSHADSITFYISENSPG